MQSGVTVQAQSGILLRTYRTVACGYDGGKTLLRQDAGGLEADALQGSEHPVSDTEPNGGQ